MAEVPSLPRLYVVEVHGQVVVVMSVGVGRVPVASDVELAKKKKKKIDPAQHQESVDIREIEEDVLDGTLGEDMQTIGLWDGDHAVIHVRKATSDEAEVWKASERATSGVGGPAGDATDSIVFLTPPRESAEEEDYLEVDPDDEELDETPSEVIDQLGFDPLEDAKRIAAELDGKPEGYAIKHRKNTWTKRTIAGDIVWTNGKRHLTSRQLFDHLDTVLEPHVKSF